MAIGPEILLNRLKPGVSIRTHRIAAASIWTVVGISLMIRGGGFLLHTGKAWLILVAVAVGLLKSRMMLDKSAGRNSERISRLKEGTCLGGVYSIKMWMLVACMILLGRWLRSSGLAAEVVGVVYVAIGWALFYSSRLLWKKIN